MSQNLDKKFRLVQNSHQLLSKSLGFGKENLHSAARIKIIFVESGNIIDECPSLGFGGWEHLNPKNC